MIFTAVLLCMVLCVPLNNVESEYIQTQILEARQLYPFRAYKDVQLFHYTVPAQVSQASFEFKANGSTHCHPKPIAVYLQYASYPVMNPLKASFPESFVIKRLFLHNITLQTDSVPVTLNVSNPLPGSWYAAAFLVDNSERIAQKGLFTPCSGWLTTFVKLNISSSVVTLLSQAIEEQEILGNQLYRFFALNGSWSSEVRLKDCHSDEYDDHCPVVMRSRPRGLPSSINVDDSTVVNCSSLEECTMKFVPANNDWNYISVESLVEDPLSFQFSLKTEGCENGRFLVDYLHPQNSSLFDFDYVNETSTTDFLNDTSNSDVLVNLLEKVYSDSYFSSCWPTIPLVRLSMSSNLAFEYNFPPVDDDSFPFILNISNCCPTYANFEVLPAVDIGGTMVLELGISPTMNVSLNEISVSGCLTYGVRPGNVQEALCESGVLLTVNTSSHSSHMITTLIPYPEAGIWYFTLLPKCYLGGNNESSSVVSIPCESSITSIFLRIRSAPCILGHCGDYGTCYQYVSGGFIFSTCNCIAGWRGWGCTDGTIAHTDVELLLDVLLLTASNILFVPAIIVGCFRRYFTEAFVYFMTMVFSAFYHACDAEVYTYCIIRLNVLQFCDFYSAILSIWVTLVAMADLPSTAQSLIHMAGAIGVALGVEYDRTGLWVIVLPAGVGLVILFSSWIFRCYKRRVCYPKRSVWLTCLLPGTLLAVCGLIIYAFFETKSNYPYVHSAWHATIALSVLFLLPKKETKEDQNDDDEDGKQGAEEALIE